MSSNDVQKLIDDFNNHHRRALAKGITLIENEAIEYQSSIEKFLEGIKAPANSSICLAVSGPPGVGKSTFINILGKKLLAKKYQLAILPIDPSSEVSGGSILADKTRMNYLIKNPNVFIRPSPSRGVLGGVSVASKDVIYALESFGFDFIIVETVGVGQSETVAKSLTDIFVVLMQPGAGDQLQAMKKGLLENADFVLVNKADGAQEELARQTFNQLRHVLPHDKVQAISAQTQSGIDDFIKSLLNTHATMVKDKSLEKLRRQGLEKYFDFALERTIMCIINSKSQIRAEKLKIISEMSKNNPPFAPRLNKFAQEILSRGVTT